MADPTPPAPPGSEKTAAGTARPGAPPVSTRPGQAAVRRVWTAGRLLLLAGGLGLTFGVFFLTAFAVATRAREVRVPDVRGKSVADATATLANIGLAVSIDPSRRTDPKVPADHILMQEPDPGNTLRKQRPVRLRVSDGQRDPIVPLVVGQPDAAATAILTQAGITVAARIEVHTADTVVGAVVAQDPTAKARASTVTLLINRGGPDQTFVMPDLIGTIADRATAALRSRNLRVADPTYVSYPGLPPGVVVRQTPQAGYRTAPDELIVLEVSR
jgi:hypothetical protein